MVAGIMLLFILGAGAAYELLRSLAEGQRRVSAMHASFVRGEDNLTAIRTSVLLGSIYLRDALVDSAALRSDYRHRIQMFRTDIDERVNALAREGDVAVAGADLRRLRSALDTYWDTLDLFLGPQARSSYVSGTGVLRRQVVPARTNVLSVVDQLAGLQRNAERQREADAVVLAADVRSRFIRIAAATLVVGVAIAWFVLFRVGSLEQELDRRRGVEAQNRRDLERLSARLVDAQEQERRVLARELHDEIGQALTALKMEIGVGLRSEGLDPLTRAALDEARTIAESVLHGVRDMSQLLHPSILDDFGLPEAVGAYVRKFSARSGIRGTLELSGMEARLPAGVEIAVYRIVQEALTNVARHSGASSCAVVLGHGGDKVHLTIEDDGGGSHSVSQATLSRGLGVIGMRERVQSLAGTFVIEQRAHSGTRVRVTIPVARQGLDQAARLSV